MPEKVKSPCLKVCRLNSYDSHKEGSCVGCLRTMSEVRLWSQYSEIQKAEVLRKIEDRKEKVKNDEHS
jgi:uncharacterized protein